MPRRREIAKRDTLPDPKFHDKTVSRFVNRLMVQGKKSTAQQIFYGSMGLIEKRAEKPPLEVFKQALENVKPAVETKSRRVGGSNYQIPIEVRPERRASLAMSWLISFARERSEKSMREKLAAELMDAANNRGNAVKKKEDTHRMAAANKAFAHYKW
ncbi:MAG: 30S ribosomal protein S7 [Proteobacteria bacterium]|jgi:small subunit ribosomal protein S7|nr:30S ribosomal protein S7 [Pseudomonadota bacterium]